MEYLQYNCCITISIDIVVVLNLIINGIPSIRNITFSILLAKAGFKPYYKWNTFNTWWSKGSGICNYRVLNLIINGIPSILLRDYINEEKIELKF